MKRIVAICILWSPAVLAQSTVTGSRTVLGSWDATGASATKPAKTGATLPGTCLAGEFFFNTAASSGQNIYLCNPNNTWAQAAVLPYYQMVQSNASNRTQRFNLNFSPQFSLADSAPNNRTTVDLASTISASTSGNAATATALASTPSQCGVNTFATGLAANGNANCSQPAFSGLTGAATAAQVPANVRARAIGATFSGGGVPLTVGLVNYFTVPFACTISAWSITVDTGTATIDVWKIPTGTAIPTVANTITASAPPALSSGTALHSAVLTGWTTSVNANDMIAFQIKAASNATLASLILECDQ